MEPSTKPDQPIIWQIPVPPGLNDAVKRALNKYQLYSHRAEFVRHAVSDKLVALGLDFPEAKHSLFLPAGPERKPNGRRQAYTPPTISGDSADKARSISDRFGVPESRAIEWSIILAHRHWIVQKHPFDLTLNNSLPILETKP